MLSRRAREETSMCTRVSITDLCRADFAGRVLRSVRRILERFVSRQVFKEPYAKEGRPKSNFPQTAFRAT